MADRLGTKWPTNCDYRPAWFGINSAVGRYDIAPACLSAVGPYAVGRLNGAPNPPMADWFPTPAEFGDSIFDADFENSTLERMIYVIRGTNDYVLDFTLRDRTRQPDDAITGWRYWVGRITEVATGNYYQMREEPNWVEMELSGVNWYGNEWFWNPLSLGKRIGGEIGSARFDGVTFDYGAGTFVYIYWDNWRSRPGGWTP